MGGIQILLKLLVRNLLKNLQVVCGHWIHIMNNSFGSTSSFDQSRPESTFTVTEFYNWKKATGKIGVLSHHVNSAIYIS